MSRVEASRAHPTNFDFHPKHKKKIVASPKDAWKEEEEEREEGFREQIVRRAVRKVSLLQQLGLPPWNLGAPKRASHSPCAVGVAALAGGLEGRLEEET